MNKNLSKNKRDRDSERERERNKIDDIQYTYFGDQIV